MTAWLGLVGRRGEPPLEPPHPLCLLPGPPGPWVPLSPPGSASQGPLPGLTPALTGRKEPGGLPGALQLQPWSPEEEQLGLAWHLPQDHPGHTSSSALRPPVLHTTDPRRSRAPVSTMGALEPRMAQGGTCVPQAWKGWPRAEGQGDRLSHKYRLLQGPSGPQADGDSHPRHTVLRGARPSSAGFWPQGPDCTCSPGPRHPSARTWTPSPTKVEIHS